MCNAFTLFELLAHPSDTGAMKSIRFKIWLSFFLLMAIFMLALSFFTYQSTKRQFLSYVNTETFNKLEFLKSAVAADYIQNRSLDIFKQKPARWKRLIDKTFRPYLVNSNVRKLNNLKTKPANNKNKRNGAGRSPKKLVGNVSRHQRMFMGRLILTDSTKTPVAGKPAKTSRYNYTPIELNNTIIGFIGYVKPRRFIRENDQRFIKDQIQLISIASVLLLVFSIFAAFFISSWLTKPIVALRRSVKQLASGDFSTRVKPLSSDEVGALCYDINELAHTLDAHEKSRRQWVADISHEMRTPVAVIKAQIESLQDGIREPSSENLALLSDKVDSLGALINDLYELSLSDAGAINYNKNMVDFCEFYNSLQDSFTSHLQEHQLELAFELCANAPQTIIVYGDHTKLRQLFVNLIENAVRYTDTPGKIKCAMRLDESKNNIIVSIEDSPPGVPDDKLDRIFDRLFRMDSSRNRQTGGAGLGLSICKNIVAAHEGDISATRSNLGGLAINVTLPVANGA